MKNESQNQQKARAAKDGASDPHAKTAGFSLALILSSTVVAAIVTQLIGPIVVSKLKQSPTIVVRVGPKTIEKGESATITWESRRASEVIIIPLNQIVGESGSLKVTPPETTTYTVMGKSWLGEDTSSSDKVVVKDPSAIEPPHSSPPAAVPMAIDGDVARLSWGCEETKPYRQQYTLQQNEEFVSANWVLLGVENTKSYTLPPPQFDPATRTVVGEASFRGLDRVFLNCAGGGHAELQLRVVVQRV